MSIALEQALRDQIALRDKIPFAEFMEAALYSPRGGYYRSARRSSPADDYFTAPSAHPAFGALLTLQLEGFWRSLGRPQPFTVVDQGAGSGVLGQDVTAYAQLLEPSFPRALRYVAVDLGGAALARTSPPFQHLRSAHLPFRHVVGCILSNELLDSFPVHRVTVREGRLQEGYVAWDGGRFVEELAEPSTPLLAQRLAEEGVTLAEGQRAEVCLALDPWMEESAATLERGFLLTIDYGHLAPELYSPARSRGTLRCYYRHTLTANPYERVGQQDITTQVDFTAVVAAGARCGLRQYPLQSQAAFLKHLGLGVFLRRLAAAGLGQRDRDANRMAMLELARPGGMGDFKVLVQSKGVSQRGITGVAGASAAWDKRLEQLPLPLLEAHHLRLMEARYPHLAQQFEGA
ncbi:MAG: SAM-dependent methyltransferase [Chloroflexi bacterium]|nr:SAM-dependent methyltransferase [Chloroflexota bacterium]